MNANIINFDGIRFFNEDYNFIIRLLKKKKGYLAIPAASSLALIEKNLKYKEALQKSTAAIFDSGYFCLLIKILKFINVKKFSGYKFIKNFLSDNYFKKKKILLLDPSTKSSKINNLFLKSKKFKFIKNYICPKYSTNNIFDKNLLNIINNYKPKIIICNIAGGVQEILACYIHRNLKNKTIIICSGAALSFFTGEQAKIGDFYDYFYLGWFKRFLFRPTIFIKRILISIPLIWLVINKKIHILPN